MARLKDVEWNLHEGTPDGRGSRFHSWESILAALLMDIRDELRTIRRRLDCDDFLRIPWTLRRISANTAKPKRKRLPKVA